MNTASAADAYKDPDRLEREIDEQRREINETLRALEEKFSSREIASQFMHYFGGPGRQWAETLGSSVKANPIPTLLTSIGLTWLMMSDRNRSYGARYADAQDGIGRGEGEGARSAARDTAESLRQRAGELGEKVSHAGATLREKASHAGDALRSRTGSVRDGFDHSSVSVRDNFEHVLREQPLALGAVGIALGALLGALLPRTQHESRVLGRASERVREQGKQMAREGYEKASRKVAEVTEAAGQTLQGSTEDSTPQADGKFAQDNQPLAQQPSGGSVG